MRSFLLLALVSFSAFAQDDFYQRQFENQLYQRQAEQRQFEAQRFEVQRVEQQRLRQVQDRQDQLEADQRFDAQQRQLQNLRTPLSSPAPSWGPYPRAQRPLASSPACPTLRFASAGTVDREQTGAFVIKGQKVVMSTFRFGPEGQFGTLVIISRFAANGELLAAIAPKRTSITFHTSSGITWTASGGDIDELDLDPTRASGHFTLAARNVRFGSTEVKGCLQLPELKATTTWKR